MNAIKNEHFNDYIISKICFNKNSYQILYYYINTNNTFIFLNLRCRHRTLYVLYCFSLRI